MRTLLILAALMSAAGAGTVKAAPPAAVYAVVQGKSLAVEPAPIDFAPFAEVKDVRMYRATEQGTGAAYTLITGNVVNHSRSHDAVITVEMSLFITHIDNNMPLGAFSASVERIAPGRSVPFSILCTPGMVGTELEGRLKNGWKMLYTISLKIKP